MFPMLLTVLSSFLILQIMYDFIILFGPFWFFGTSRVSQVFEKFNSFVDPPPLAFRVYISKSFRPPLKVRIANHICMLLLLLYYQFHFLLSFTHLVIYFMCVCVRIYFNSFTPILLV